ncbi:MAG: glutathione synthase [Acidobacteria bacterium]|nr:glutathione synthase [Acidobacteriota bacterium]MCA1632840.1 glutathione synthase [Acidobacteriota bacterium]MCA1640976.1 glutathione synthase [Acidobacteriota bacterium]
MILFCGIPSEPPLRLAIDAARAAGTPHLVFNQREAHFSDLSFDIGGGTVRGTLRYREADYPLEGFTGVYTRLTEWRTLPENRPVHGASPDIERLERSRLVHEALGEWMELADCRVLNTARAMASNVSKPYQAQIIARGGLLVPPTLVTNDPAEAEAFARARGRVIYKSVSSVRSIVRELRPADLERLDRVGHLPTQFQSLIPGTNVRVHVVGGEVFATRVETESVDYRYASRDGEEVRMIAAELPPEVRLKCVGLSETLGLPLCGIDLKVTPAGEWYCFEVNPSPAYSYYEENTGQPISRAIVALLGAARGKECKR